MLSQSGATYCVMTSSCAPRPSGTRSASGWLQMMTPQAWMPIWRLSCSIGAQYWNISRTQDSFSSNCFSSGDSLTAFASVIFGSSGMSFVIMLPSAGVRPRTRATSFTTAFAFSVPYVPICDTLSSPYFWIT